MGEVYVKTVIDLALQQVGKECGKTNEYSKQLDSVEFYNFPKNGVADSCSIFVDDMVFRASDPQTAKYVRSVMYEPNKDNCGASCKYAAEYFKKNKAYITDPHAFQLGDKIFFKKKDGKLYHTGLIVGLGDKIETVEGNTNGGKVAKKSYSFNDEKIDGAGRPRYTGYEPKQEGPKEDPEPTPVPTPAPVAPASLTDDEVTAIAKDVREGKYGNDPERKARLIELYGEDGRNRIQARVNELIAAEKKPSSPAKKTTTYIVKTNTGLPLRLRVRPNTNCQVLALMDVGSEVEVSEILPSGWAKATYNGINGYCSASRLVKED